MARSQWNDDQRLLDPEVYVDTPHKAFGRVMSERSIERSRHWITPKDKSQVIITATMLLSLLLQLFDPRDQETYRYRTEDCTNDNCPQSPKVDVRAAVFSTCKNFILRDKHACALC